MKGWPGWAAALTLGVWYLATMARGLMFFDSGEFALVASEWGVGHPPGQPLYTLLLGLFGRLPGVDPLTGMNALSAVCAALCAIPADSLIRRVSDVAPKVRFLALLGVGAIAPLWDQATRIELYSLATFLTLWLLAAGATAIHQEHTGARRWFGLGLLAGALAGVNPVFAAAGGLSVGLFASLRILLADPKGLLRAGAAAALGGVTAVAATYSYVYAVRDATDRFIWGTWTGDGPLAYFGGADYGHTEHGMWALVPEHAAEWGIWLAWQGALPIVLLGFIGWFTSKAARSHLPLALAPMAMGVLFTFSYGKTFFPQVPDYNGYLAPLMWLGAVGLATDLGRLKPKLALVLGGLLLTATLVTGERPVWQRSRAGNDVPESYARAWLEAVPEGGVAVIGSDHLVFPAWYLHQVDGVRPDIVLINEGFAGSSWYWRNLHQRYDLPDIDLAAPSTAERLRRLFRAMGRPVVVESLALAAQLRMKPCPATWGIRVGDCQPADDPAAFDAAMAGWWARAEHDLITPRVLANVARTRADIRWFFGDVSGALRALKAGLPPGIGAELPVPDGLRGPQPAPPLPPAGDRLIGSADGNLEIGAALLAGLNRSESETWTKARR